MTAISPYDISMATDPTTRDRSLLDHGRRPLMGLGYISGAVPSNAADATNDIAFTAGVCTGQNGYLMKIPAYTKQLDATFALGSAAGGWTAGGAAGTPSDTTYHCFALWSPQRAVGDIAFDTSATAVNALANSVVVQAGFTEYRRIFSFKRISSANQVFTAREINGGGLLVQIAPLVDFSKDWSGADDNAQTGTSTRIPVGVQMLGEWNFFMRDASAAAGTALLVTSFDVADTAPVIDTSDPYTTNLADIFFGTTNPFDTVTKSVLTRASDAAIRYRGSGTTADHSFNAQLRSWTDFRVA